MLLKYLKGTIKFHAQGCKGIDFINDIKNSDLKCLNIQFSGEDISGMVYFSDLNQLKIIAQEYNMKLFVSEKKGIPFWLLKNRTRYGIIIGILAVMSMGVLLSNIVLKIEIQGNSLVSDMDLIDCLKENGISYGKFIPNLQIKETERKIQTSFKEISWITISHKGGRVIMEVSESESPIKIIPDNIPCNIISAKNAQIVDMQVLNGHTVRQIGDAVKPGDMIVSGIYTDIYEKSRIMHSVARVTGQYKEKIIFEEFLRKENVIETGRREVKTSIKILGLEIPLYFKKNKYKLSDIEEEIIYLEFFGYKTPVGIAKRTYYECIEKIVEQTDSQANDILSDKINSYEKILLKDHKIISKEVHEEKNDKVIKRVILYVLEGEIGKEQIIIYSDNNNNKDVLK